MLHRVVTAQASGSLAPSLWQCADSLMQALAVGQQNANCIKQQQRLLVAHSWQED